VDGIDPQSDHDQNTGPSCLANSAARLKLTVVTLSLFDISVRDASLDVVTPWEIPGPPEVCKELGDVLADIYGGNVWKASRPRAHGLLGFHRPMV
jgi:hypothetical protein